jgi:transposase, IS5 family
LSKKDGKLSAGKMKRSFKTLQIASMLPKEKDSSQLGFFASFEEQLNHTHPLYKLAKAIDWTVFENAFSKHYSLTNGAPAKPIRRMVSLLILKQLRNLSDESVVEQWAENSYYHYLSGEKSFCQAKPCVPTELVEFRKRIGGEGVELIFKESIRINGHDSKGQTLSGDTTVQEKNITYPTDDKLYKKIISKCRAMASEEGIELRQSYTATIKKLSIIQRMKRRKNGDKQARKAGRKIKAIAGRLVRELERKLPAESLSKHTTELALFKKVLSQKRHDTDKTYSLHEPHVKCYTKGKEHKKFEFGSKASFLITQGTGVIVGALNFSENLHDSKTLPSAIEQHRRLTGVEATDIFLDRGYRGPKQIEGTRLHTPKPDKNITKGKRKKHQRRAAIEPVIGHLKHNYRMIRNYLKGTVGDEINVMMAAAAMNFKRKMNSWREHPFSLVLSILWWLITDAGEIQFRIFQPPKMNFYRNSCVDYRMNRQPHSSFFVKRLFEG